MTIAYFDTSAIVPLIVEEAGSDEAKRLWRGARREREGRLRRGPRGIGLRGGDQARTAISANTRALTWRSRERQGTRGAMVLGAPPPLVVTAIPVQRLGRQKIVLQVYRLMTKLGPHIDRVAEERERWRSDLSLGEMIEWSLQSPLFKPRPKS